MHFELAVTVIAGPTVIDAMEDIGANSTNRRRPNIISIVINITIIAIYDKINLEYFLMPNFNCKF
jgi:hypothetical protein